MRVRNDSQAPPMQAWVEDIAFERPGRLARALKAAVVNPCANYLPSGLLKALLRFGSSELAAANWADPGGWRSMVISYDGRCGQVADKLLVRAGTIPMALRNRKRLGARLLVRLFEDFDHEPVYALCLGAGPGQIITEAMTQTPKAVSATLVDRSADAFAYGRRRAEGLGLADRVRFVQGDVRDVKDLLDHRPDVVKMLGICEYLTDEQIADILRAVAEVCHPGTALVLNSLSRRHGTDRFFRRVFGLRMIHRTPRQLQALAAGGGFGRFAAFPEPLGVYHVIVGRKLPNAPPAAARGS
jgi:ubiquinone/menaquinone biosynthesis C-methylase UbiE